MQGQSPAARAMPNPMSCSGSAGRHQPRLGKAMAGLRQGLVRLCSLALLLLLLAPVASQPAWAYDNPDLLPTQPTPVIDLAKLLTDGQRTALEQELVDFEASSGWKLRVLTQYDRTPGLAIREFWGLDERSLLLVADERGGNLLNFNVGDALFALMPRTFWVELQTRYGNQFYVRDQGYDQSILSAIDAIATCLDQDGCAVVPGIPQEQWILTLITSIVGGVIFGFAGHPRKDGEIFAWKWALIFTPLWGMLFISFGLGPVLTRTSEWVPIVRNVAGFVGGAVIAYLIPSPKRVTPSPEAR